MTTPAGRTRWVRRLGRAVSWILFAGVLVLVWPSSLGGCTTLVAVSGHSMEPTLQPGDLAIVRCGSPTVGDVVAYHPFPELKAAVIHRIIGGDEVAGWKLQGDNNTFVDPFYPVASQVQGVMVASVPRVGSALALLGNPFVWGSAFVLAAALLVWPRRESEEADAPLDPSVEDEVPLDVTELEEMLDAVEV